MPPKAAPIISRVIRKRRPETDNPYSDEVEKRTAGDTDESDEILLLATGYGPIIGAPPGPRSALSKRLTHVLPSTIPASVRPGQTPPLRSRVKRKTKLPRKETSVIVPEAARKSTLKYGGTKIHTSSVGFLCGLHATIDSIRAQYPQWTPPTIKEFQDLLNTPEAQEFHKAAGLPGLNSQNNCRIDQIALVIKEWGLRQQPRLNLRLGVIVDGQEEPTLPPMEDYPDTQFVWVHNDGYNLEDDSDQDGDVDPSNVKEGRKIGHYSGIRPKQQPSGGSAS